MTKELQEIIVEILNNSDINVKAFLQLIKKKEKEIKALKKQKASEKEKRQSLLCSIKEVKDIENEYDSDWTLEDVISEEVDCYINDKLSLHDIFAQDDYPDEGVTGTFYIKYGDKFYELEIHCGAEWIGDWSVRANVPSGTNIKSVKEIKCKVLNDDEIELL